jgi:hypothetical protein
MQLFSWVMGVAALGINLHALVALVRGLRADDVARIARLSRRVGWMAAGFVLLLGVGLAGSILTRDAQPGGEPSDQATRFARNISETVNTIAFGVFAVVLPCIVAVALRLRARRAPPPQA